MRISNLKKRKKEKESIYSVKRGFMGCMAALVLSLFARMAAFALLVVYVDIDRRCGVEALSRHKYQVKWVRFDENGIWYSAANFKGLLYCICNYH